MLGDATQLRQVIHNLVQNALDAVSDSALTGGLW
jgi:C4-dicarboxylate-specific signal transduction histidine kinase